MPSFFSPMDEPPFVPDAAFEGPPSSIPGSSPQRALLFQSSTLGVAVFRIESYASGFAFTLRVQGRDHGAGRFHFLFDPSDSWAAHGHDDDSNHYESPEEQFRVGVSFSDGSRWENFVNDNDADFKVRMIGGGGSRTGCTQRFWVPALPPPGRMTIHGLWPSVGMGESAAHFDADQIRAASAHETPILPC